MSIGALGENLIFVISTPRAGSTLLQRILSNAPGVHTLPEPWIVLPGLYTSCGRNIDKKVYRTEYNPFWARTANRDFVGRLPGGEDDYIEGFRRMYGYLYNRALEGTGCGKFVDKGPRYYLVMPELLRVFPRAVYIVLLREPVAILSSICRRWINGRWHMLKDFKVDLVKGMDRLASMRQDLSGLAVFTRYEDIVRDPSAEIKRVCEKAGITFSDNMLTYEYREEFAGSYGFQEQRPEYRSGVPDPGNLTKWCSGPVEGQLWRLMSDYLEYLGKERMKALGYSYEKTRERLDSCKPGKLALASTRSLFRIIRTAERDSAKKMWF